jgi:hypothetical protein
MVFTSALIPAFSPEEKVNRSTALITNHPYRHLHSTLASYRRRTLHTLSPGERAG